MNGDKGRMYQWRDMAVSGSGLSGGGAAVVLPRGFGRLPVPASRSSERRPFRLVVDLGAEPLSLRWWRGAGTLGLLCAAAAVMAPGLAPVEAIRSDRPGFAQAREYRDAGVSPLARGGQSGGRMNAGALVEPLLVAPERAAIDLDARLAKGDRIEALLMRIGVPSIDAVAVGQMVREGAPRGLDEGTELAIRLGRREGGLRRIERIALRAGLDSDLIIERGASGLVARTIRIAVDARPRRIRGRVGDGLYWSLRGSGVSSEAAGDYLKALATKIDVGADLGPDDRFDLVIAHRRAATGEEQSGPLLYAGVERMTGAPIQMLKWTVDGRNGWFDAASLTQVSSSALAWPVSARITSGFGMRRHPILGYARMHKGIDFGARWGAPILASADGVVSRAGWAGGYGRQVRIAHGEGIATSYSHLSRMVVNPGSPVRQGQLIGYVGSSGLSTGPHLHYETHRGGVAVNPTSVRFANAGAIDPAESARFKARLAQLLGTAR